MSIAVDTLYHTPSGTVILSIAWDRMIRVTVEGKHISFMSLPLAEKIGILAATKSMLDGYKTSGIPRVINDGELALAAITHVLEK